MDEMTAGSEAGADIAVVGGGIIGLTLAWQLGLRGLSVVVVEGGEVAGLTSRASAGMVTPLGYDDAEVVEVTEFGHFRMRSSLLWRGFAERLTDATGLDSGFRVPGCVLAAVGDRDASRIARLKNVHDQLGIAAEVVDGPEIFELEPVLNRDVARAMWVPDEGCVDRDTIVPALREGIARRGGRIVLEKVSAVKWEGDKVAGIETCAGTTIRAATTVVAAGAWSMSLNGIPQELRVDLRTVKGQSVVLEVGSPTIKPRTVVRSYMNIVPKVGAAVIAAGTSEEGRGHDTRTTAGSIQDVLERATRSIPSLADARVLALAAGLRPFSPDGDPILGPSAAPGLWWATGHSSYGVQSAPLTATLIADGILGDAEALGQLKPFGIERFRH